MGLRRRIFLNHLATLTIVSLGTLVGLVVGNHIWKASHGRVQTIQNEIQVIDDLNIRILQALPARNHYAHTDSPNHILEHIEKDSQVINQFTAQVDRIQAALNRKDQSGDLESVLQDLIQQTIAVRADLDQARTRMVSSNADPHQAVQIINELLHSETISKMETFSQQLDQQRNRLSLELETSRVAEERGETLEVLVPVFSTLLASLSGILFAWRTSGLILRPIDRLNQRIAELRSSGNLDLQPLQQGQVPREILELTENFNGLIQRLREVLAQLESLSLTDSLTQVGNRRCFDHGLQREVSRHRREGESLALLLLDLDHFKAYNDRYGHPAGDQCLIAVADLLKKLFNRGTDQICRIGGEEFAVILPTTSEQEAQQQAQRIIDSTTLLALEHRHNPPFGRVTVSVGVSSGRPSESLTGSWLLQAADQALYRCKGELGRNVVACAPPHDPIHPSRTSTLTSPSPDGWPDTRPVANS